MFSDKGGPIAACLLGALSPQLNWSRVAIRRGISVESVRQTKLDRSGDDDLTAAVEVLSTSTLS